VTTDARDTSADDPRSPDAPADEIRPITRVGVVGAGTMGLGIAEVAARAGCSVILVDAFSRALDDAPQRLASSLKRAERKGLLAEPVADIMARIACAPEIAALANVDLVHEVIKEERQAKAELLRLLEDVVGEHVIIASNTSSIPISWLGSTTTQPERVVGLHFFNPVPIMPLVEVIAGLRTSPATQQHVTHYAEHTLGKRVITAPDRSGFIVNALLVPYLLAAVRMLESGVATREDIDAGMVAGCGMPIGPLALCDLIGLDTMLAIADTLFAEYADPGCAAPPLLRRHVDAGMLGRKTGQGFFDYAPA